MLNRKSLFLISLSIFLLNPLNSFSSRKKAKDTDEAALKRQQELLQKREKAEEDIANRKAKLEREEAEKLEAQRLEAERLEKEKEEAARLEKEKQEALEKERLEKERLEAERIQNEKAAAEKLEAERLEAERLENEKKLAEIAANRYQKEYLTDYIIQDELSVSEENNSTLYSTIPNPDERDAGGRTLLMRAAKSGNEWQIQRLIDSGADINLTDNDGWTALMYAVRYSEGIECVELLIDANADIKITNKFGNSALTLAACYNNNPRILSTLLKSYKATDKDVLRSLVLMLMEQNITLDGLISKLDLFIDIAAPLNSFYEGKTPLMYAAQYCNTTEVIKILLDNQASVTLRSTEGKTAFDYALNNNNLVHDETFWALNKR